MRFVAVTEARYHVQVALPYPGRDIHVKTRPKFSVTHNRSLDSAPNLEKYKAVHIFPMQEIEIRMIATFRIILLFRLKLLWIFEAKSF